MAPKEVGLVRKGKGPSMPVVQPNPDDHRVVVIDSEGHSSVHYLNSAAYQQWRAAEEVLKIWEELRRSQVIVGSVLETQHQTFVNTFDEVRNALVANESLDRHRWDVLEDSARTFGTQVKLCEMENLRKFQIVEQEFVAHRERLEQIAATAEQAYQEMASKAATIEVLQISMRDVVSDMRGLDAKISTVTNALQNEAVDRRRDEQSRLEEGRRMFEELRTMATSLQELHNVDRRPTPQLPPPPPPHPRLEPPPRPSPSRAVVPQSSGAKPSNTHVPIVPRALSAPPQSPSYREPARPFTEDTPPEPRVPSHTPSIEPLRPRGRTSTMSRLASGLDRRVVISDDEEEWRDDVASWEDRWGPPRRGAAPIGPRPREGYYRRSPPLELVHTAANRERRPQENRDALSEAAAVPLPPSRNGSKRSRDNKDHRDPEENRGPKRPKMSGAIPPGGGGGQPPVIRVRAGTPSDPTSSSSSSDDGSADSRRRRYLEKKKRRAEKRDKAYREHRYQSKEPQDPIGRIITVDKPKFKDPESFDGNKSKFDSWYGAIKDRLTTCSESFTDDHQQIIWAASLMKGKARDWYETRKRRLKSSGELKRDTWKMFIFDLKKRFRDPAREVSAMRKVKTLKYSNSIEEYLDDLQDALNDVDMTGQSLIWLMREQVPFKIWEKIPNEPRIKDSDEYMSLLRDAGVMVETLEYNKKAAKAISGGGDEKKTSAATESGSQPQSKNQKKKDKKKAQAGNATQQNPPAKKSTEPAKASGNKGGAVGIGGINEGKSWNDAHKGIDQIEVDSRKSANACTTCGELPAEGQQWPHSWKKCPGPKRTKGGPYKTKAAAAAASNKKKRKRNDDTSTVENSESKKAKPAAAARRALIEEESSTNDGEYYRPPNRCALVSQFVGYGINPEVTRSEGISPPNHGYGCDCSDCFWRDSDSGVEPDDSDCYEGFH